MDSVLEVNSISVIIKLCLIRHYIMEMNGGVEVELHTFLTSALDGGE
jgi:hypothetical protein